MPTTRSLLRTTTSTITTAAVTVRRRLAAKASDLLELAGLAGLSVSVAGVTENPWWGALVGSVILVLLGVVTDEGPRL